MDDNDHIRLRELEESLWRAETRFDQEYMNKILAAENRIRLEIKVSSRNTS